MLAFPVSPQPSVLIDGSATRFPIRRVFCVGQNYADHAREMGGDPTRQPPFFFTKPADAVTQATAIPFPPATSDLHHEVELVVALQAGGSNLAVGAVPALICGHAVGLDLTRRDLQATAKAAGRPWDMAKGFDRSAPIGAIRPGPVAAGAAIRLTVDGKVRQQGTLDQMIWSVPEIVATLSTYVELMPGDLIFTGTPAGVGPIRSGERLLATIDGLPALEVTIG